MITAKNRKTLLNASPYSVDLADIDEHREVILTIWASDEKGASREDKLDKYYLDNPAGPPIIFLLWSDNEEKYVGVLCTAPRIFFSNSTQLVGMVFADLVVEPSHRTLGPSALLLKTAKTYLSERVDFLYGFMNPSASFVGKRIGLMFRAPLCQLVFPLAIHYHVAKRLPGKAGAFIGRILHLPVLALMSVITGLLRIFFKQGLVDTLELSIDAGVLSASRDGQIIGQRNSHFLEWRLGTYPDETYVNFGIKGTQDNLLGYISYYVSRDNRVHIQDIVAVNSMALIALITLFCRKMMKTGQVSVQIPLLADCKESMVLRRLGFQRSTSLNFFCDWAKKHASTFATKSIFVTTADNDV